MAVGDYVPVIVTYGNTFRCERVSVGKDTGEIKIVVAEAGKEWELYRAKLPGKKAGH